MSANGLETFDRSIHATNLWLKEISNEIGTDRRLAWRVLGVVLRVLRDRLPVDDSAHFAAPYEEPAPEGRRNAFAANHPLGDFVAAWRAYLERIAWASREQ